MPLSSQLASSFGLPSPRSRRSLGCNRLSMSHENWRRNLLGSRAERVIQQREGADERSRKRSRRPEQTGRVGNVPPEFPFLESYTPELRSAKPNTKLATIVILVGRKSGASISALTKATGWQPHTTRAALTRLRKRGYRIARQRTKSGESVYRLGKPASSHATAKGTRPKSKA